MDPRTAHKLRMMAKQAIPKSVRAKLVTERPAFSGEMRAKFDAMRNSKNPKIREAALKMEASGVLDLKTRVIDPKIHQEHDKRLNAAIQRAIKRGELPPADPSDPMVARHIEGLKQAREGKL